MSRRIVLVVVVSGLLKVLLAFAFADLTPRYDEVEFLEFGRRLATGEAPMLWRAPGYPSFVAAGLTLAGGRLVGVRLLQALLSVATTLVVYRLGRRLGGERVGLVAAAFLAFYPSHVAFSHLLWSETLFLFLTTLAFDRLLSGNGTPPLRDAVVAGALLGAASLVRSAGVALVLASATWLLFAGGRRFTAAWRGFAIATVVVIAPWSIQASVRAGRFVLSDTNPGWNLWSGNNEYVEGDLQGIWGTGLPLQNGLGETWGPRLAARGIPADFAGARLQGEWRQDLFRRLAADGIRDRSSPEADEWYRRAALAEMRRDPVGVIARVPRKLAGLWSPDFFLPRHLLRDWYGRVPAGLAAFLVVVTWLAAAVPLLLGPAALGVMRPAPFRSLALAWILTLAGVHALLFGVSRMHQPIVPLLVLAPAMVALGGKAAFGNGRWRQGIAPAAVALLLVVLSLPVVVGVYVMPGPRHEGMARVLAAVRHLPLPGARHATWMLAEVEAARGRDAAAIHVLEETAPPDDPGTMLLRALCAPTAEERLQWARRGLHERPESELLRTLAGGERAP